ncbi:MAG: hypothetical protein NC314_04515 [Roseburia sp.]|nr:hypothetical protein [Roseburia sp.]MCM1242083.1 hypothetical protein [Roseburia sp.]
MGMEHNENILELQQVCKTFPKSDFRLDNVSFALPYGSILGFVGENAAALSHHPQLLLLDEATSGLDPIMREEMLDVFLDFMQKEDHSILLSSHITGDLEKVADYIAFIHDGRLLMTVPKDDLLYRYGVMRCKESQLQTLSPEDVVAYRKKDFQIDVLVSDRQRAQKKYRDIVTDHVSIDEIMLLLVKGERL